LWVKNGTCGRCWIFCPDMSIFLTEKDGKFVHAFNLDYCKGCGICAHECPTQSIKMVKE
ncbi:MAG: 4Fe-4S binding protein, partial [Candidatus Thorarchaeota archaeon]|nr:4Fe-4S binding protein [Candidatus Thorarchaeota archaeon]